MCDNTIYCQRCSQTNTSYHISYLADDVICQKSAGVIFKDRINDAVNRHNNTQNY